MNLEQRDIASGLELEERLLFLPLPHSMSLTSQIVLERNNLTNHLLKINLQKLMTKGIQIKEEMTVYNLLIIINLINLHLEDLTQVYQNQIPKKAMMICMVHQDHPNKQAADQQEGNNRIPLLLYHLKFPFHLDLIFLNHLNILIHLQAIKRTTLQLLWNLVFILSEPLNQLFKKI